MKSYHLEHLAGYQRMLAEGKRTWDELHGNQDGFEFFASRSFLEQILPRLRFDAERPRALEIGSGTGPGACFLAQRRFQVDGIELIAIAVDVAREIAAERGLDIQYHVLDVTELPGDGIKYDLIVDSYCLQGIVLDSDRRKVFSAVRARLKPHGYYLVSTAMYNRQRHHPESPVTDHISGKVFHRYDDDALFDPETDIYYSPISDELHQLGYRAGDFPDGTYINDELYLPWRRYRSPQGLAAELQDHAFRLLLQTGELGQNVVCIRDDAPAAAASAVSEPTL